MKHHITRGLKNIALVLLTIVFIINISEFIELYILCKPKENCWLLFGCILTCCAILYFILYKYIWSRCVGYIHGTIFKSFISR